VSVKICVSYSDEKECAEIISRLNAAEISICVPESPMPPICENTGAEAYVENTSAVFSAPFVAEEK